MKISVITWDASFREKFHTIDSFCTQDYPDTDFEFIWVDFYNNTNPKLIEKIEKYPNASLLNLNNSKSVNWHLGKCMNAGIEVATGEIIVLVDGDIIVERDHLKTIANELNGKEDTVVYFRRWDELKETHSEMSYEVAYLEKHTRLFNATNYAGCYALHKSALQKINGYEENIVFSGPGANGMETYLRLRNAGFAIKWHDNKIYHPWHTSSGSSDKMTEELIEISRYLKWLHPYMGIEQSWVLKNRELDLSFLANDGTLEEYLKSAPTLESLKNKIKTKSGRSKISLISKLFK